MADGEIHRLASRFRLEVAAAEDQALRQVLSGYARSWAAVERQILELVEEIAAAQRAGRPAIVPRVGSGVTAHELGGYSASKHWQLQRLQAIQDQLSKEITVAMSRASEVIQAEQSAALERGARHGRELIAAGLQESAPGFQAGFTVANLEPLKAQIGFLSDGTPLNRLLAQLPGQAVTATTQALTQGMALGLNPTEVAKMMQGAIANNGARARLIARTEMLRSYREATREVFKQNDDVLDCWVWNCSKSLRTCAMCWAMHGREFDTAEMIGTHPNCRCAMMPKTKTWADLGFKNIKETRTEVTPGPQDFAKLKPAQQRAILGPSKFDAYSAGDIELRDLVQTVHDSTWGTTRTVSSLRSAQRRAARRKR